MKSALTFDKTELYDAHVVSMEPPEEPMAEIQLTIRQNLEAFERRLTGELTEKLTERKLSQSFMLGRRL